jgi:2-keto-4-pentenoate hydratase
MAAVEALHIAIEVPDSRYEDYAVVGAPQLIADNACACWFVLGPPVETNWRDIDLAQHEVRGYRNDTVAATGRGANVLGDPRVALVWIVNERRQFGGGLRAGHIVTTGTCIVPIAVAPGDRVRMDFGVFGSVEVELRTDDPDCAEDAGRGDQTSGRPAAALPLGPFFGAASGRGWSISREQ